MRWGFFPGRSRGEIVLLVYHHEMNSALDGSYEKSPMVPLKMIHADKGHPHPRMLKNKFKSKYVFRQFLMFGALFCQ